MIGALYTLLLVRSEPPKPEQPPFWNWAWNPPLPPKRKRDEEQPEPQEPPPPKVERLVLPSGKLSPAVSAYLDSLQARIAQAAKEQELARRALDAALADAELEAARAALAQAVEAERLARQQLRDLDVVFVTAVLVSI